MPAASPGFSVALVTAPGVSDNDKSAPVKLDLPNHRPVLQRRERGVKQRIAHPAAVVENDLAVARFDHLDSYHAVANGLRGNQSPGERIAVRVVKLGDAGHPVIEFGQGEFPAFGPRDQGVQGCGIEGRIAGHLDRGHGEWGARR